MALIKSYRSLAPKWGRDCYFSENATIVGDVTMGDECSVWFNAVVRGDVAPITIGNCTKLCTCDPRDWPYTYWQLCDDRSQRHCACLHHPRPYADRHGLYPARRL